jgi:serine/threonine protein phosphatase PrpC
MIEVVSGYSLNYDLGNSQGFDAIYFDLQSQTFVLCDGANSTPWGGHCAELCCSLLGKSLSSQDILAENIIKTAFDNAQSQISETFSNAACTAISLKISSDKLWIAGCGDSQIELLKEHNLWGWQSIFSTELNQDSNGNPSQLIGRGAYAAPDIHSQDCQGTAIALLMSDGVHRFTSSKNRIEILKTIKSLKPSSEDLNFLAETIAGLALSNGSKDDISILILWMKIPRHQ